jgi:CRISPR-associated protein Cas2
MYVIVVYDIGVERINQVRGFLRQYLNWVQNSVFEGELTDSGFMTVKNGLEELIDKSLDSVIIYRLKSDRFLDRTYIGEPKVDLSTII